MVNGIPCSALILTLLVVASGACSDDDRTRRQPPTEPAQCNAECGTLRCGQLDACGRSCGSVDDDGCPCDDGDACTTDDRYASGACSGMFQDDRPTCDSVVCGEETVCGTLCGEGSECVGPADCAEALLRDPSAFTGLHLVNPDGPGPLPAQYLYCDMDFAEGGWSLIVSSLGDEEWIEGTPTARSTGYLSPDAVRAIAQNSSVIHIRTAGVPEDSITSLPDTAPIQNLRTTGALYSGTHGFDSADWIGPRVDAVTLDACSTVPTAAYPEVVFPACTGTTGLSIGRVERARWHGGSSPDDIHVFVRRDLCPGGCAASESCEPVSGSFACVDFDECEANVDDCELRERCENTEGSFRCVECGPGAFNDPGDGLEICVPTLDLDGDGVSAVEDFCGPGQIASDGPLLWYRFEEVGPIAVDSARSFDGAYGPLFDFGPSAADASGGVALELERSTDNYVIVDELRGMSRNAFTIALWARFDDEDEHTLFSYASEENGNELTLWYRFGRFVAAVDGDLFAADVSLNQGEWNHLTMRWSIDDGIELLVNGQSVGADPNFARTVRLSDTGTLVLGQDQDAIGGDFELRQSMHGAIDEVALFARFLDPRAIREQMAGLRCAVSCTDYASISTSVPSGEYIVDFDPTHASSASVRHVACEMTGGATAWTRIHFSDFEAETFGWTPESTLQCSTSRILGPSTDAVMSSSFDLFGVPHSEARVRGALYLIDGWDGEAWSVRVDGAPVVSGTHTTSSGEDDVCMAGASGLDDRVEVFEQTFTHTSNALLLEIDAALDAASPGAIGVDDVEVWVR